MNSTTMFSSLLALIYMRCRAWTVQSVLFGVMAAVVIGNSGTWLNGLGTPW
jgi:hypothetical protein